MTERKASRVSNGQFWTSDEIDLLIRLHEDGRPWAEVGEALGRTAHSCSSKYSYERSFKGRRDEVPPALQVPASVLIERDRRSLAPRSLSALFFGDPPQGFSALDRRGA